jgi:hypothetical protein
MNESNLFSHIVRKCRTQININEKALGWPGSLIKDPVLSILQYSSILFFTKLWITVANGKP